jgi:hypothetical protein
VITLHFISLYQYHTLSRVLAVWKSVGCSTTDGTIAVARVQYHNTILIPVRGELDQKRVNLESTAHNWLMMRHVRPHVQCNCARARSHDPGHVTHLTTHSHDNKVHSFIMLYPAVSGVPAASHLSARSAPIGPGTSRGARSRPPIGARPARVVFRRFHSFLGNVQLWSIIAADRHTSVCRPVERLFLDFSRVFGS